MTRKTLMMAATLVVLISAGARAEELTNMPLLPTPSTGPSQSDIQQVQQSYTSKTQSEIAKYMQDREGTPRDNNWASQNRNIGNFPIYNASKLGNQNQQNPAKDPKAANKDNVRYRVAGHDDDTVEGAPVPKRVFNNVDP